MKVAIDFDQSLGILGCWSGCKPFDKSLLLVNK